MNVLWTMMEKDKATVSGSATNAPTCTRQCRTRSWVSNHLQCLTLAPLHGILDCACQQLW
jgi:hypothetical protein